MASKATVSLEAIRQTSKVQLEPESHGIGIGKLHKSNIIIIMITDFAKQCLVNMIWRLLDTAE